MKKNNVILIGMPGSGKTTLGFQLAEHIGYGFIDSDDVIVAREGKTLPEIIAEKGREGFLDVEAKVNSELCAHRCVIATGGECYLSCQRDGKTQRDGNNCLFTAVLSVACKTVGGFTGAWSCPSRRVYPAGFVRGTYSALRKIRRRDRFVGRKKLANLTGISC